MAASLYDAGRGRAIVEACWAAVNDAATYLHIPAWQTVWSAGSEATHDFAKAAQSGSYLAFLLVQPVARLLAWMLYWLAWFVYKYILVEGIYNHGLSQAKEGALLFWKWQSSLTRQQLLMEAAILLSMVAIYQLKKFLERRRYWSKACNWMDRQKRQLLKSYYNAVRRIARVSLVLAAMTSHLLFLATAAAIRLFAPRLAAAVANAKFIGLFSFYYPLFCTITAIFQYAEQQEELKARPPATADTARESTSRHSTNGSTTSKTKRRQSYMSRIRRRSSVDPSELPPSTALIPSSEDSLEDEMEDWLRFWMVRASVEALKVLLSWATPTWFTTALLQLELLLYVWIYCLPFIQPESIAGQALPEGRPLRVICRHLGPYAAYVVEHVSGAVPLELWKNRVVGFCSQILGALVLVRLVKKETCDWLLHVVEEGRSLVIPALTLMTPGFLTRYGVVYVQYALSTARSHRPTRNMSSTTLWLKYWVLHAILDATLQHFASLLWWIPFSTHVTFCLWCYLSLPQTVKKWYNLLESELKLFGVLPGQHEGDFDQTNTARFLGWIWAMLPKAKDDDDDAGGEPEIALDPVERRPPPPDAPSNGHGSTEVKRAERETAVPPVEKEVVEQPASPNRSIVAVDTSTTMATEEEEEVALDDVALADVDTAAASDKDDDDTSQAEAVADFEMNFEPFNSPGVMTRSQRRRAEQERRRKLEQRAAQSISAASG